MTKTQINEIAHLATGNFLDRKGDNVEIYRSINPKLTGRYFGSNRDNEAEFEIVVFGYKFGNNEVYIRYPDTDIYVEMYGGGGSSRGSMTDCSLRNIIREKVMPFVYEGVLQAAKEKIYKHEDTALYHMGSTEFNFLRRVANFTIHKHDGLCFGGEYITEMLNRKFIPLPEERIIAYSFITNDNKFVIVDQSAYNFTYEGMRCFYGDFKTGIREGVMTKFERYRDGGTTLFDFTLDNVTHKFFRPSTLGLGSGKQLAVPSWDGHEMIEIPEKMLDIIVTQLEITLAPEVERN